MKANPTVIPGREPGKVRVPLSVPQRKLEVQPLPGYYLRWFRGTPGRIAQALRAGFDFVSPGEVDVPNTLPGGDANTQGSTDMGDRVSIIEGSEVDDSGQAVRLYLMKQKLEYKEEDDALIAQRNDSVVGALTSAYQQGTVGGLAPGETAVDAGSRYVDRSRTRVPELFRRKR